MTNIPDRPFLTVRETAKYLRYHEVHIYRLLKNKLLPGVKIGGSWRVSKKHLDEKFNAFFPKN